MRGYKTKENMMREALTEQNDTSKSTKKQSKITFKVVLFVVLVLILGVCAIIGYNHKTFEHYSDNEYADSIVVANDSLINGHRYVDLGLSVMWADCNIGSDNPYNHGMICGWADITGGKGSEDINDYPSANPPLNISGNDSYDIACSKWGKEWRLPTVREFRELLNKCEWIWVDSDDGCGYKIIGPNGNSIFLPTNYISGTATEKYEVGAYWTGTLCQNQKVGAMRLHFDSSCYIIGGERRNNKYSIRPVVNDGSIIDKIPEEEASEVEEI